MRSKPRKSRRFGPKILQIRGPKNVKRLYILSDANIHAVECDGIQSMRWTHSLDAEVAVEPLRTDDEVRSILGQGVNVDFIALVKLVEREEKLHLAVDVDEFVAVRRTFAEGGENVRVCHVEVVPVAKLSHRVISSRA